ncbi:MAG TPA: lysophospholipid acyltransferase family protein [Nocardioidaceae bacterium]|nr:lysophospholipid acyltransferase family protein [Nocardioidaceae bacterium]
MPESRRVQQPRGWAFAFCATVLEPLLVVTTRRRWSGGDNLPASGGCVLAVNHISHLDPLTCAHFVYAQGRMVRFLAKAEVFDVPLLGTILRSAGQIPVHRLSTEASASFTAAVDAVQRGECVVVYPEGTITRQPELWPMTGKTGAARIALASGAPVIPVAQWGAQHILPPYTTRPHLLPRKTITMAAGPPVALDDLRSEEVTPLLLREATDRIMDDVTALLEGIRGERAPAERYDPRVTGVRLTGNPASPPAPGGTASKRIRSRVARIRRRL